MTSGPPSATSKMRCSRCASVGGALVLCDWKGAIRKQYRIAKKQSAVFVLGSGGELRSLRQGTLTDADATSLLRLIEQLAAS
jgi:predicted transcriptional regulator